MISSSSSSSVSDSLAVGEMGQGLYALDLPTRADYIFSASSPSSSSFSSSSSSASSLSDTHFVSYADLTEPPQPKLHPHVINATAIHADLIHLYFNKIHPHLPILHKHTFYRQLESGPRILLLNAIYAVASQWTQSSRESPHPPGWAYYQTAFSLIDIYTDVPRLSTIQALLLLVKYQEYVRRPGYFWRTRIYLQLCIRMCKDLGLERAFPMDAILAEQRKRTFWAVYAHDVLMR